MTKLILSVIIYGKAREIFLICRHLFAHIRHKLKEWSFEMNRTCKIYSFANQKGGVGKTTSAVNLAASTGALGKKTLLVDLDPQGNSTSGVGVSKRTDKSVYDALINAKIVTDIVAKTKFPNLDLLPSNIALAGAEVELVDINEREFRLTKALDLLKDNYDYIFIDCPPSLSLLTINALCAADGVYCSDAVRILRSRGTFTAHDDNRTGKAPLQSHSRASWRDYHDVRRQTQSFPSGSRRN